MRYRRSMQEPSAPRVLIIEDEAVIRRGLCDVFRFRGCEVTAVGDGQTGLERALSERFDLLVLDIMLPELDGFSVCERVRACDEGIPILMLTAKGEEDDVVRGFEVGANDYVTKPFGIRELTARADALLRRGPRAPQAAFDCGPLRVRPSHSDALDGERSIALTAREVRILHVLAREPGHIVARRTLLRDAWDMHAAEQVETRTVDMHIAKLRRKLGRRGPLIATVRGQGYRLEAP